MILNIDPLRSAVVSIFSAAAGSTYNFIPDLSATISVQSTNAAFQYVAWAVAIVAGIISAWNGFMTARDRYLKNHQRTKNE